MTARLLTVLAACSLLAVACSSPPSGVRPVPSVSPSGRAVVVVAVGASDAAGVGADDPATQSWPQVLYRAVFPRAATLLNLGLPGATVQNALAEEVPDAVAAGPDVVVVLLGVNDLRAGVDPTSYRRELTQLLGRLRGGGSTTVLVGNVPPLDHLPAFTRCAPFSPAPDGSCDHGRPLTPAQLDAMVNAYDLAIDAAATSTGATVVDLRGPELSARRAGTEGSLVSADGFHPSTAGHRLIADAFAMALQHLHLPG